MQTTNAEGIAAHSIRRFIDMLYQLFLSCQQICARLVENNNRLTNLDENNPDYSRIRHDFRENMKAGLNFLLIIICLNIDYILTSQPLHVLAAIVGTPEFLCYVIPGILILLEIGIAYSQILAERKGETQGYVMRNIQYLVIFILLGFSCLYIGFTITSYDPRFDGSSFIKYLIDAIIYQVCFLIAGVLLHLFLIKNSEIISEIIGYISYRLSRFILTRKIKTLQSEYVDKSQLYKKQCIQLIHKMQQFRAKYPNSAEGTEVAMPAELLQSINTVLGKRFFDDNDFLATV